ncbi:MAG: V-type ATPase subunit [Clostridia bacterium]|nr:V-type ATPase subunit [Clostridia bacterium]
MSYRKEDYICVSAMLRGRELKMLDNSRAERMLEAASFEDAAKVLADCGYPDLSQLRASEIDAVLAERRNGIFAELERMVPDRRLIDVFRMKYDYHNVKAILKGEATGQDVRHLLSGAGRVAPIELQELYREERFGELPPVMAQAMTEARNILARTANPQLSDFVLDKAYFTELRQAATDLNIPFLADYAALLADSVNLRTAVRTRRMGKDSVFLGDVLLEGGTVELRRITAAEDGDALRALYAGKPLEKAAALGAEALEGGSLTAFERACDNAVNAYLKKAKYVGFGAEPVAAYLAAVEEEITAIRMMLAGRLAGVSPDVIRERMRDLYA